MTGLPLELLPQPLTICRLNETNPIPAWASESPFFSMTRTRGEFSIVCETMYVPKDVIAYGDWRAFLVAEPLDFNLTGILCQLIQPMAEANISVFAISTYDTDYILIRAKDVRNAFKLWQDVGHRLMGSLDEYTA